MGLDIKKLLKELTLEEKAKILTGYKNMQNHPVERLNIPSLVLSDGPLGIRKENDKGNSLNGISNTLPATCFPSPVCMASTWNKDLLYKIGKGIGKECNYYKVDALLGPAVNIKRNPRCGRNFEYYSEDPLISGIMGSKFVKGVQSENVAATPKHFACNNNEKYRFVGDSIVDERALREIYLKPFEIVVKESNPWLIMNAYNKIQGTHASENGKLMNQILRDEWGFTGAAMTDWGGIVDRTKGLVNGTDLEMPGQEITNIKKIIKAVEENIIDISVVDKSVERIFNVINKTKNEKRYDEHIFEENYNLSINVSDESAVLLENDGILPLSKDEKYLVIGDLFKEMRYQGSGSSLINAYKLASFVSSFNERNIRYDYARGYKGFEIEVIEELENEALDLAKENNTIIYFMGQNDYIESEGFDRDTLELPLNQLSLLNKLLELNKKIIVVLFGGSTVELPFKDQVNAILYVGLPGEGVGLSTTKQLFGEVSPSGRLTETWIKNFNDVPFMNEFISTPIEKYKESIFVGYRYYNTIEKEINYPFGYGLSYSNFEYNSLNVSKEENYINVSVNVKNIGSIAAKEVIEIYASINESNIFRPKKVLIGFDKVNLKPSEEKEITLKIKLDNLKVFDINHNSFVLEEGLYNIHVSKNVDEDMLITSLYLDGKKIENTYKLSVNETYHDLNNIVNMTDHTFEELIGYSLPTYEFNKRLYTLETPIGEFDSFFGKIFKKIAVDIGLSQYKKACKEKDSPDKERRKKGGYFIYKMMPNNSLRSMSYSSGGMLKYKYAKCILELTNGHFFKGMKELLKKNKI